MEARFYKPAIRPPWKYYGWSKYAQMSFLHLYNILCRYFMKRIIQRKGGKFHRNQMFWIQPHHGINRNVKNKWLVILRKKSPKMNDTGCFLIWPSSLSLPKTKNVSFLETFPLPEWPVFFLVLKRNRAVIKHLLNKDKNIFTNFDDYLRRTCLRWRPTPCLWGCKASIRPGLSIFLDWWWWIRIYLCNSI